GPQRLRDTEEILLCASVSLRPVISEGSSLSESCPEPELHHPRLIRDVRIRGRRAVSRVALGGDIRTVVRVVEQVEHLDDAIDGRVCGECEAALDAEIDSMNRIAHQGIWRD